MRKWLLVVAAVLVVLLLAGIGALVTAYRATQKEPEFYTRAMAADPAAQKAGSDQMLHRVAALLSDVKKPGRWQAMFTEEQLNGWLAVDLVKNHSAALPLTISDPRVSIEPGSVTFGCRVRQDRWQSVLSLKVDVYLAAPDKVALRIRDAHAGAMPLPLDTVLAHASRAAQHANWRIEWRQADGDPVAVIPLEPTSEDRVTVEIDKLSIQQGAVYVSGTTKRW